MAEAKIEIKVGAVSFSGEGNEKWLSEQLDKMLEKLPALANIAPVASASGGGGEHAGGAADAVAASITLASFLKGKNATTKQVRKFLATAAWLHARGKPRLSTGDVAKALSDHSQARLSNPADCLAQNVGKGFCEKSGKEFFVTTEGSAELSQ